MFQFKGVLYMDEHSFLDSSRLAVNLLMHNAELVGVHGMASVELCWCIGEGALKCSLILSPSVLPDSPM